MNSSFKVLCNQIINEISKILSETNENNINILVEKICKFSRIFCYGAGRSGIIMKSFCMRLNHLGIKSFYIGDIVCPPITKEDLLILTSGSGETSTAVAIANKAKEYNAHIACISTNPQSALTSLSNLNIIIKASGSLFIEENNLQPMRTVFEQSSFILFESIILMIKQKLEISNFEMAKRHANLE